MAADYFAGRVAETSVDVHYGGGDVHSAPFRYVWPSELDLMAQLAGMGPRSRWSGWEREPFTSESTRLVGVWKKPA